MLQGKVQLKQKKTRNIKTTYYQKQCSSYQTGNFQLITNKKLTLLSLNKITIIQHLFSQFLQNPKTKQYMHYSKHEEVRSNGSRASGKISSAIEKAEAIQQREQLRQMVFSKFIKDFSKNNKQAKEVIEALVTEFFTKEKITEESLRGLKQRVIEATANIKHSTGGEKEKSVKGQNEEDKKSVHSNQSRRSNSSQKQQQQQPGPAVQAKGPRSDASSDASSTVGPKSVYYVEGDEEDEWATLVKFDTELFKKEKELERMREEEFKKKMKLELDRQLQEKKKKKEVEKEEHNAYANLQTQQIKNYDEREHEKKVEQEKKIQLEKQMRDKQVKDEHKRRKVEKKKEDELDKLLVNKIKEELTQEEREALDRREKERQRLQLIMAENEANQAKIKEEAEKERLEDIRLQNQYLRLQKELEEKREAEKKEREDKIKKVMSSFADTVIKDQKDQIKAEDEKMLKHIQNQSKREQEEDERRKQKLLAQQKEMREYLAKQVQEKKQKEVQENQINTLQATIWKEDLANFKDHEEKKKSYIDDVNKKHQEILLAQMAEKEAKQNRKKMNTLELLYNKALMKEAAEKHDNVKKTNVAQ